jgi:hypothetical protein
MARPVSRTRSRAMSSRSRCLWISYGEALMTSSASAPAAGKRVPAPAPTRPRTPARRGDSRRNRPVSLARAGTKIALLVKYLVVGQHPCDAAPDTRPPRNRRRCCRSGRAHVFRIANQHADALARRAAAPPAPDRSGGASRGETAGPRADSPTASVPETAPAPRRTHRARARLSMTRSRLPRTSPTSRFDCASAERQRRTGAHRCRFLGGRLRHGDRGGASAPAAARPQAAPRGHAPTARLGQCCGRA